MSSEENEKPAGVQVVVNYPAPPQNIMAFARMFATDKACAD